MSEARTVWKFPLGPAPANDPFEIEMPQGAKVLTVQRQLPDQTCIWALVDPYAPKVMHRFVLCGTGHSAPGDDAEYVGTFQLFNGSLVWHLFKELP